ncbi:hypothetical protein LJPFL01_3624 [Lelliottia jeotgali]|nr:hypothetical protein LJPFL01_3624 [Lelliottia jeotgali]
MQLTHSGANNSLAKPSGKPRFALPARLNFAQHYFNLAFIPIFVKSPEVA